MGAALIAAGNKRMSSVFDVCERRFDRSRAFNAGRIIIGADKYKVVVHERHAFRLISVNDASKTFRYESFLGFFGVDENYVGVAVLCGFDSGARACRRNFPVISRICFEIRLKISHETTVVYRRGG